MKIEFILIIENNKNFCETNENLINYLKSYAAFTINDSNISLRGKTETFRYILKKVSFGEIGRYFNLAIENDDGCDEVKINAFSELLSSIKEHFAQGQDKRISVYSIWDDIAYHYALLAYPHINELENTMRKMILKFMLIGVGVDWFDRMTPEEIKKKVNYRSNEAFFQNVLYELDFIHLSKFLFENKILKSLSDLERLLLNSNDDNIKVKDMSDFIANNNWNRYFAQHVQYNSDKLKANWDELYRLRNKIAHNRGASKNDYETIKNLSASLKSVFEQAIVAIENSSIILTNEQKLEVHKDLDVESLVYSTLQESRQWLIDKQKSYPGTFIGYTYFLSLCAQKGVERDKAVEILNSFEKKGIVSMYYHENNVGFDVYAINVIA